MMNQRFRITKIVTGRMIEVRITQQMMDRSRENANRLGVLRNSIERGEGNIAGYLGQEVVLKEFSTAVSEDTYDYDLRLGDWLCEVKTKRRSVPPKDTYECSVAGYNVTQKADFYVFTSLLLDKRMAWIVGFIEPKIFYETARCYVKGTKDPSNGFVFHCDTWNLPHNKLRPAATLHDYELGVNV